MTQLDRSTGAFFDELLGYQEVLDYFLIHESEGIQWFDRDRMEKYLNYFEVLFINESNTQIIKQLRQAVHYSDFQLDKFRDRLSGDGEK